jgi:hypothetical protein
MQEAQMILSRHATVRAQQRGISSAQLSAVATHGDMETHRGGDCYATWISKEALRRLGPMTPEGVSTDRLKGLTLVQSEDGTLVTAFRSECCKAYRRIAGRVTR